MPKPSLANLSIGANTVLDLSPRSSENIAKSKQDLVQLNLRMEKGTRRKLRLLAAEKEVTNTVLVEEAMALLFAKYHK